MATYDLEEQEQIDALKAWWKHNGSTVILAFAIFVAAVAGVQGWRHYQSNQAVKASMMYEVLQSVAKSGDAKKTRDAAGQIMEQHPGTPYAARAALIAAHANYDSGDVQSAKAQLLWVTEHAKENEVRDIARLRLAGLLLDEKDYAQALKQVETQPNPAFAALFADMKGDILAVQGKQSEARGAYQIALDKIGEKSPYRQMIKMKMENLGG
jgi:predicted negative regulator of RcsB-dependent stress response